MENEKEFALSHASGLYQKCRIEMEKSLTKERALLQVYSFKTFFLTSDLILSQFQVIIDQFSDQLGEKEAPASSRLRYIYGLDFPPFHALKLELGRHYLSLGVAASALQLFQELEMVRRFISKSDFSNF